MDVIAAWASLKNGLELVLTFLSFIQILYLLIKVEKSNLYWTHTTFIALIFIHFCVLNAYHYFSIKLFSPNLIFVAYGAVLHFTFLLINKKAKLKTLVIQAFTVLFIGLCILWFFVDYPYANTIFLFLVTLNILSKLRVDKDDKVKIWFKTLCIYFIILVGISPMLSAFISIEYYLYFKIPYSILFAAFLMHNFSFFLEQPKFFHLPKKSATSQKNARLLLKIEEVMINKKAYKETPYTLGQLSVETNEPVYKLSKIINQTYGKTFPELVNFYRIEEIKASLLNPEKQREKVESIAFEAGFSTPSAFYAAFKKTTGMTPTAFKKHNEPLYPVEVK